MLGVEGKNLLINLKIIINIGACKLMRMVYFMVSKRISKNLDCSGPVGAT